MEGTPLQTVEGQKLENHCQTGGNTSSDGLWLETRNLKNPQAGRTSRMDE